MKMSYTNAIGVADAMIEANKDMELTTYSVRLFLAPAFGISSCLALYVARE